ncbi:Sodium/calcium exchanger protein-domain-containing protein [Xylariomycetidae sp. FL0641]|nr:Sodium/calcium exchanger protein-domain-containing protein [Xylariomycetidae sp. FL0641]
MNDAERGEAEYNQLRPSTSVPPNFPTTGHDDAERGVAPEGADSQATAVPSPPATSGQDGLRARGTAPRGAGSVNEKIPEEGVTEDGDKPEKKKLLKNPQPKEPFTVKNQLQRTFLSSYINILLLAAPAGIALWAKDIGGPAIFGVNFIAIIPLANLLSNATEEIALRTGEVLGGLINATFGNAVELIVAIIALIQGQVTVVQTSLVGSILSNLLLVLGFCFLCGGVNRPEQFFNTTVAQTSASLLALAVASLIVPTVFSHTPEFNQTDNIYRLTAGSLASLSHGVAIILLIVYACYLFFQLKTHSDVFNEESQKVAPKDIFKSGKAPPKEYPVASGMFQVGGALSAPAAHNRDEDGKPCAIRSSLDEEEDEEEEPQLHFWVALAQLLISTVIIAVCSEGMVSGIEYITAEGVSEEFVGLILLPIVGNACEHATAVTVAIKDKMDLAIGVAIGSSMQVALFLIPLLVIIGWGIGNEDMTLAFDTFQIVVLFVSVLLVNYLIGDGKSHWLEGALLAALYLIIAVCAWFYPNDNQSPNP